MFFHVPCRFCPVFKAYFEYAGRVDVEWDVDGHEYLVTSCDPNLPVRRFLEMEGLLTGQQRKGRNMELLLEARGGPPLMPEHGR